MGVFSRAGARGYHQMRVHGWWAVRGFVHQVLSRTSRRIPGTSGHGRIAARRPDAKPRRRGCACVGGGLGWFLHRPAAGGHNRSAASWGRSWWGDEGPCCRLCTASGGKSGSWWCWSRGERSRPWIASGVAELSGLLCVRRLGHVAAVGRGRRESARVESRSKLAPRLPSAAGALNGARWGGQIVAHARNLRPGRGC